jgi:hypothetical protein
VTANRSSPYVVSVARQQQRDIVTPPSSRAIAMPPFAFAPVKRALPGVRLAPARKTAFRPLGAPSDGAKRERSSLLICHYLASVSIRALEQPCEVRERAEIPARFHGPALVVRRLTRGGTNHLKSRNMNHPSPKSPSTTTPSPSVATPQTAAAWSRPFGIPVKAGAWASPRRGMPGASTRGVAGPEPGAGACSHEACGSLLVRRKTPLISPAGPAP